MLTPANKELWGSSRPGAEVIKGLSTPYFPLDIVREFVMNALSDAVKSNQVHNRDPIGGSNENLYVYVPNIIFTRSSFILPSYVSDLC